MTDVRCSVCGKPLDQIRPCIYNRMELYTCDECCKKCHDTEPFYCREYDLRVNTRKELTQ